ncbi:MAG: ABC transporter ATP-binding protein [Bdellovibrionales bacterium]|nr:ABC transporter ATP-binding protein [Bdellovibrionales bacterium]
MAQSRNGDGTSPPSAGTPAFLEVRGVAQGFRSGFWMRRKIVLSDLRLSLRKNAVLGLVGPNGAGKTTLIHLLTGIKRPISGEVLLEGKNVLDPRVRGGIGYLPERPHFYEFLTGRAFLMTLGAVSRMDRESLASRVPLLLERVGLKQAADRELRTYSKGMLQRIGIAQAILHSPSFVVLDEPMSGLDPRGRTELKELIRELAREGRTLVMSSHVLEDVDELCDQVALIQGGRLEHLTEDDERWREREEHSEFEVWAGGARYSSRGGPELHQTLSGLIAGGSRITSVKQVRRGWEGSIHVD